MQASQTALITSTPDYNELPPPPPLDEQLLGKLDAFIKGDWKQSHQCITMIRAICKQYPQYIPDIFTKYGPSILDLFSHPPTQLFKNLLLMLKEIFAHGMEVNLEGCVAAFLPLLTKKAALDSGKVKEMCQEALTVVVTQCCYCNTLQIATELTVDKSLPVADLAMKLISAMINALSGTLTQINPNTLQIIMKGMNYHIKGKRNNMKTSSLDICLFMYNSIGSENFLQLMNYSLTPQEVNDMGSAMETHRTSKPKVPHLSEVLKQEKNNNGMRMSGNYGQNIRM